MTNTETQADVAGIAASVEAIAHLAIRSPINRAIYAAIREHRLSNMTDEDGYPYPLVDLMSNPAPCDIGTGEMAMIALADEIEEAVLSGLAVKAHLEQEGMK